MTLEPSQILHVESPGLPLELLRSEVPRTGHVIYQKTTGGKFESDLLLICTRVEIEHVEEGLDIELGEDTRSIEQRKRLLGVIRRRLEWVPRHVVFRPWSRRNMTFNFYDLGA